MAITPINYPVIDGDTLRKLFRARDLGQVDSTQLLGYLFSSLEVGDTDDTAAVDHTSTATIIALMKAILRDLGNGGSGGSSFTEGSAIDTNVTTAETAIATIDCRGKSSLGVRLSNTGATALATMNTDVRYNSTSTGYQREANYAGAYNADTSANNGNSTLLVTKSGVNTGDGSNNPFSLEAGATTWIRYNVKGVESVQLVATVGSGSTDISVWWMAE